MGALSCSALVFFRKTHEAEPITGSASLFRITRIATHQNKRPRIKPRPQILRGARMPGEIQKPCNVSGAMTLSMSSSVLIAPFTFAMPMR